MKGLLKYLSPFAPDQSGAASVLYDLGGITVICDAGGCTGNICGFDEPRWFVRKSAIFSAGLRDMDAILGRDDRLIAKLKDTAQKVDAKFAAIIGTPVPAVIATDYRALQRMAEKRCELPVITVECTGTRLYDVGEETTYMELFQKFAEDVPSDHAEMKSMVRTGKIGVIGTTPLDLSDVHGDEKICAKLQDEGYEEVCCYGMGSGLEAIREAGTAEKNLVVSPAGLKAAQYLQKRFGTPYEVGYPLLDEAFREKLRTLAGKKILVIHQQVAADEIRREIRRGGAADVTAATWFMQKEELREEQDFTLTTEDQFIEAVEQGGYDVIIGDALLKRALRKYQGEYIGISHFAVSGKCVEDVGK
jgi:nitrogenase molybdenum-iron protein alpha/beta subunit